MLEMPDSGPPKLPNNPYQAPSVTADSEMPIRLRRGRLALLLMAAITTSVTTWEILNHNLFNGWAAWPGQLFRGAFPLILMWLIWRGHAWARYVLVGYCGFTLCVNLSMAVHLPEMISKGHTGDAILVLLMSVGYLVVGSMALFSTAISSLLNYRHDERDLA